MDFEPQQFFKELTEYLKKEYYGSRECLRHLEILNRNLIEEQIDSDFLDNYLIHIFNSSNGLLKFIEDSAKIKIFRKASCKAVEILYTVVNNFPTRLSDTNVIDIYKLSTTVTRSSIDALIKSKVFDLLLICFEKINNIPESNNACKELFIILQNVLQQNHSDTVKQKEMMVLGAYIKKYRYLIEDSSKKKLESIFLRIFQKEVTKRQYSQTVLCGFFTGFLHFCETFPLKSNEDKLTINLLYKWIKELAAISKTDKIKMGNRAAVTFFTKNIDLFTNALLDDHRYWHEKMLEWLNLGSEERKTGIYTAKALYQKIGEMLKEKSADEWNNKWNTTIQYFNSWGKAKLENQSVSTAEKHLAIYCLRHMSEASYKHLDVNEVTNLFLSIMQIFEQTYILNYNPQSEDHEYLPDYIQTVSNLIRFKTFTASEFFCLQRATINMIKSFHQLPYLHHTVVIDSIIMALVNLKTTGHFDTFLENIIYQGVVWSCSHQHISNDAFADEILEKIITVKNYFPLWIGILQLSSNMNYDTDIRQYIVKRVVNELIRTMMILINKLNLSVKLKEANMITITDIQSAYQVEKNSDYSIFLNVVDLYQELFNHIRPRLLKKCIFKIIMHLISKCLQFPLTSGFYKLLSFSLKIINSLKLFENVDETNADLRNCRESLQLFLSVLLNKIKDYKDELAIACLHVLLESPVIIIKEMLPACETPFINIFNVGKSYLPLTEMGIHTLQHWQENIEPELLDPVLIKIIPSLDTFLRSKSLGGHLAGSSDKRRKTAQALKKRKVILELEPELVKVQRKILNFIGKQSLKNTQAFVFSDDVIVPNTIWGQNSHLKIILPYEDIQLEIYLDTFLPRIVDLALHCSDRKTRITACELVQAIIMIFLGKAKPMTLKSGLLELNDMLKFLSKPLLQLSCDVDQVVRQIFEPLFLQLIHWYTSPMQLRGAHTGIIIDTIMEGITHPTNSSIRDFSGQCVNEFLKWTIKQSSEDTLAADPVNVKVLVKRMRYFSSHPDHMKKLGAALIFNNIYRELREEEALISIFWLEILHIFVNSLSSIEYGSEFDENIAIEQTKYSLMHVQRVFVERVVVFRKTDHRRRVPNDLNDGTLKDVAIWLLNQSGNMSKHCRDVCMDMFIKIAPLCTQHSVHLTTFIKQTFDGSLMGMYNKLLFDFPRAKTNENYAILYKWMNSFLCALDGYNFVFKNNLVEMTCNYDTLCNQIDYFLSNLQDIQLGTALNLIEEKAWRFTLSDVELFNNLKMACIFSVLKLHKTIVNDHILVKTVHRLWNEEFWRLICNSIFFPESLGINEIVKPKFLDLLKTLLSAMANKLSKDHIKSLVDYFKNDIKHRKFSTGDIKLNVGLKQRNTANGLLYLNNIYINQEFKEYLKMLQEGLVNNLVNNFCKEQKNTIFVSDLPETTFKYFSTILEFSLTNKNELVCLIEHLHSPYVTHSMEFTKELRFGIYFLKQFSDVLLPIIINNFDEFLALSMAKQEIKITVGHIDLILIYIIKNKRFLPQYRTVYNSIMNVWPSFVEFFNNSKGCIDIALEFTKYLIQLNNQCSLEIHSWLLDYLIRDHGENYLHILNLLILTTDEEISLQSTDLPNALFITADKLMPEYGDPSTNTNTLGKILSLLPDVKSSVIFRFMVDQYLKSSSSVDIAYLVSKFISIQDQILQQKSITIVVNMCFNQDIIFNSRYKLVKEVLPTLMQNINLEVFEQFYVENINKIVLNLKTNESYERDVVNFILVELLFLRLPIGSADRQNCPISAAANEPKLLAVFVKCALDSFKVTSTNDTVRKYKCHAYNALASMVSNSMKLSNFYEKLFVRTSGDKDILWSGIIDTTVHHKFQLFFETLPKQRKVLVNIRDELRAARQLESSPEGSMRYIESQRLFNSSLSEDVTNFDFTNSVIRTQSREQVMPETKTCQSEVFLDATVINEHECMATICGLIQHMFDKGIEELPKEDEVVKPPSWMNGIRNTLLNPNTHNNIKIFLVKLLDNLFHIFTHYSKWFIEPLLQFVIDKCAGSSINYFITDVLVILSKWAALSKDLSDKERQLASQMLVFLVEQLDVERKDFFKYNVEIIKLIVESWKSHILVPIQQMFTLLRSKDKCELGIHLSSVFLVNRLAPWQDGDAEVFLDLLMKKFSSSSKSVLRPAAETVGLALHFLKDDQCTEKVNQFLKKVDQEHYIFCLEALICQTHCL